MTTQIFPSGLCQQCIQKTASTITIKRPDHCINCQKLPDILFNKDPYCKNCYIILIGISAKSQRGSCNTTRHAKTKSFFTSINKQDNLSIKKSLLSNNGKLIKKINKLFQEQKKDGSLIQYLRKKGTSLNNIDWDKFISKVNKFSNIVYIFIGRTKIIGAYHSQKINIEQTTQIYDEQSGVFETNRLKFELQFGRIGGDIVVYNNQTKSIKFGNPSTLEIVIDKNIKIVNQMGNNMEWSSYFLYHA